MQSPSKLQARLNELLAPPGAGEEPSSDPIELALRTVVATTSPMIQGVIEQWTPEQLDHGLELVALFFLQTRSDGAAFSAHFLHALGELMAPAAAAVESTAEVVPPRALEATVETLPPADSALPSEPAAPAADPPAPPEPGQSGVPESEPNAAAVPPPGLETRSTQEEQAPPPAAAPAPPAESDSHNPAPPWG